MVSQDGAGTGRQEGGSRLAQSSHVFVFVVKVDLIPERLVASAGRIDGTS
jgi:hypothetical protein